MLNISNIKSKNKNNKYFNIEGGDDISIHKHYPSANKEWYNSIYAFNKNTYKLLPIADKVITKLIKAYFNMYNRYLNRKNRIKVRRYWLRKFAGRKFWLAKPELKHTNDKVIINLYIYNRNKVFFLKRIKTLLKYFYYKSLFRKINKISNKNLIFSKKLSLINTKLINNYTNYNNSILNHWLNINSTKYFKNLEIKFLKSIIRKILRKEIYIMHLIQSSFFTRFKFNSTYIFKLALILNTVYNKKIVLNIIRVKNFFLNSDIFTQILVSKTRNRRNKILKVLRSSLVRIKLPIRPKTSVLHKTNKYAGIQNNLLVNHNFEKGVDLINTILNKNCNIDKNNTIDSFENKMISGIRIKASGRLTKRNTASRSLTKIRYKGNLKHLNSSLYQDSSVIIRGNIKSNIQFTKLYSKTRIGSFGIKGWISSR